MDWTKSDSDLPPPQSLVGLDGEKAQAAHLA